MLQKKYFWILFFILQVITIQILAKNNEFIEQCYSNGIYQNWSLFLRKQMGGFSVSIGDILYALLLIYGLYFLFQFIKNKNFGWKNSLMQLIQCTAIFYFLFHISWGLNYYRLPLFEKMSIKKDYSEQDLIDFTEKMIVKCNAIQFKITKNKNTKVAIPYSDEMLFKMAQKGYRILEKKHPPFHYQNLSIKKSIFSIPLSYMGFGGYLNPFTNEAQINYTTPKYHFPATICHEMAHQIGYGSESECNFIGYLAANKNPDLFFQYAANCLALRYCLKNIQGENSSKNKIAPYLKKLHTGILENFKEDEAHSEKYYTFIDVFFEYFYDNFLKINQQEDGIESYSKFLNLLINYEKSNNTTSN
jgi:hypothetical protein